MGENEYRISLGVQVETDDIKSQLNTAEAKLDPIKIKIDAETKELANTIKAALKSLTSGTKNALTLNTDSLEASLKDVSASIKDIKTSLGTLDSKSGMKSLLASINQISSALEKASNQFESLNANLNALSGKDLNFSFGINMGGSNQIGRNAAYGQKVRGETLPQLKQQMGDLVKYYNTTYKQSLNEFEVLQKMVSGTKLSNGDFFENFLFGKDSVASRMNSGSLASQMQAYKQYIDMFKQAASLKGLDLSSVTSKFSKSADQLVQDAVDIQTGAREMEDGFEKLKQVFGGGNNINVEGLSAQLEPIVKDLNEIREAVVNLSKGVSIEGLTQSFDRLSETIEKLVSNVTLAKNALGDGLDNVVSGDSASKQAQQAQKSADTVVHSEERKQQAFKETAAEAKKLDNVSIDISSGNVDDLKNALRNLKVDDTSIENATKELNELNIVAKSVSGTLKDGKLTKWEIKGVQTTTDELERAVTITKTLGQEGWSSAQRYSQALNNVDDELKELNASAQKTIDKLKTGFDGHTNFDKEISNVNAELSKLSQKSNDFVELKTKIEELERSFKDIKVANDAVNAADNTEELIAAKQRLVEANEAYERSLKDIQNQLKINKNEEEKQNGKEREVNRSDNFELDKQKAMLRLRGLFDDNTEAARKFGSELNRLQKELAECGDDSGLRKLNRQIDILQANVKNTNVKTDSFATRFKKQWSQYSSYFSVASVFMYAEQGLRDMFEQVKAVDAAMTELKKVTNETDASYSSFLSNAASRAKEIGTTVDGLVTSTADFARLGYGFGDAQELAEVANVYAVVGDEIDSVDTATKSLISTMTAFGVEASDSMTIVDKFNEIGNNFAISSGGIGDALERSASSMAAANNTLDETIALITAANTVVQDADSVGTAFKTISMRIRGAKTELSEAGLDAEGMASSTAKLREEIIALSGVDIMLDSNTFKSTYKIMEELAAKWQDLTDIQQASITELIAGKRQGNIVSALMTNFDIAQDALQTSLDSSGSAMKEHGKYMDSLEAKLSQLKAAWQSFALTFMDSDFLKGSVDVIKGLVEALDWLVDNFGLLGSIGLGAGITSVFKYFKGAKEAKKTITDVANGIEHLTEVVQNGTVATNAATDANLENAASEMTEVEANTASVAAETAESEANLASVATETNETMANATSTASELAEAEANATSTASELAEAEANLASSTSEISEATANATSAASELAETTSSAASVVAETAEAAANLGGAVATAGAGATKAASGFAAFATSTAGVVAGIGILVAVIGLAYNAYKNAKEAAAEARQEAIESSSEYLDAASSFERAYIKYSGKTDLTASEEADLESAIQGTVDALDDKSSALQSAVNNSNDYLASLEAIKKAELDAAKTAAEKKRDNAAEELREAAIGWESWDGSEVNIDYGKISYAGTTTTGGEAARIAKEINSKYFKEFGHGDRKQAMLELSGGADTSEIVEYYNFLIEYRDALKEAGYEETSYYTQVDDAINKMSDSIALYTDSVYQAVKASHQLNKGIPKTAEEYIVMREAILTDSQLDSYSVDQKMSILNSLDSEYGQLFDLTSAEAQARKFVGIIKGYGNGTKDRTNEIGTVETFLNMRTAVNNNECTVGQYLSEFNNITSMAEKFSDEEKKQFNLAFGLDTDTIKEQYESVYNYISRNYLEKLDTTGMSSFNAQEYIDTETERIQELLSGLTATELAAVVNIKGEIDWANTGSDEILKQIKEEAALIEAMNFTIAIDVEAEGIEALNTALAESKSATGLATESIAALKARYEDLDGYNAATLFEETANGIRVNSTELAKLEEEYKDLNKQEIDKTLETLKKEYDELTGEINNCTDDQEKLNDLYSERDAILDQINDVATLAAQFEGLTSAYNEWQNAQEAGQDRDMYESVLSGREDIEDEMSRGWLDDAAVEYLELLTGQELSTAGIDAQIAAYKELANTIGNSGYSIWDFFTEDEDGNATSDGVFNFFDTVKSVAGETAAWIDENGAYHFDFEGFEHNGKTGDAAIAEILGTSEEVVQMLLKAAEDAGFVINIEGKYTDLANASDDIHELNEQLKTVGATDYTFNVKATDLDYVNEQIAEAQSALQYFENRDGKINLDDSDVRAASTILAQLTFRKSELENPALMSIDVTEPTTKLEEVLGLAQQLKDAKANLEIQTAIGADTTEAQAEIDSLLSQLSSEGYADIVAGLSIDASSVDAAIASINAISVEKIISVDADFDTSKIDGYVPPDKDATVTYGKDSTEVDEYDPPNFTRTVTFTVDSYSVDIYDPSNLTRTVTYKVKTEGEISEANGTANANGTAFANGTSGRAFKQGDWGIKGSGTALGGELGTEILVRNGRWYTIGDNGAEFFQYKKGDIIFNHRQTEELFANGKATSGGGRGKALVEGTAFAHGSNAFGGLGRGFISQAITKATAKATTKTTTKTDENGVTVNNTTTVGSNSINGAGKNDVKDAVKDSSFTKDADKFEETFDWIEIAISRVERAIDNLDQTANNVYKSWSDRNSALSQEIGKVREEIELQDDAAQRYLQEANSVGLDESYAKKIRNGTLDIDTLNQDNASEELVEKIKDYQKWYELSLACTDAAEKLREEESKLYAQRFENVQAQYDGILQGYEHTEAMLNEYISQAEEKGYVVSKNYYDALIKNEESNIAELKREQADLIAERDNAVATGKIVEGSEAWYEQCAAIDEVTQAIESGTTSLIEYNNAIRDIDWQIFDLIQERISDITAEADFLIELMSNKDLFDDNGKFTEQGVATVGLHALNYNTSMYQADDYGKEVAKLDKQIAKDPYDQELINRRRELLELQRESILAAEDEKNAIKDLVEEGINLELDALQERIDLHNEELDSMKDLYDYQKNVEEQTKNIASLRKQLGAYEGFDDEETRAKVQELKVSLEEAESDLKETEYDKFISDQTALLDNLFLEYENVLNARLDDTNLLIQQVIDGINIAAGAEGTITTALSENGAIAKALGGNATTIGETLKNEVGAVGVKLSTAMNGIWTADGSGKAVIDLYGKDFQNKYTTTNDALNKIKTDVTAMVDDVDKDAQKKVQEPKTQPSSVANPVKGNDGNKGNNNGDKPAVTDDTLMGVAAAIWCYQKENYGGWGVDPARKKKLTDKLGSSNAAKVQSYINSYGANGKLYNFWVSKGKNLDKYKYSAFKLGAKNIDESQFAWTQENGQEFIVRPSDGAILTPVAKGDSVLTSAASSNIWDMANSPAEFIKDNLNLGSASVPNNSTVQSNYTQHFDKVIFNMPNVKNYGELLSEMQRDPKFEKLILAMTVDQIAGKSSLAKGKSIR